MRWNGWLSRIAAVLAVGSSLAIGCGKDDSGTDGGGGESGSAPAAAADVAETSVPAEDENLETVLVAITGMT